MTSKTAEEIRFDAQCNAMMHIARRRKLEWWNRVFNLLVIVLGTAGVASLLSQWASSGAALAAATAVIGALQLVFDFGGRARTHEILQRRYYDILAELEEHPNPEGEQLARLGGTLRRIYGEEPPISAIDNAIAYNEAADTLGAKSDERLHIPVIARILATFFPIPWGHIETIGERKERLAAKRPWLK